jgi:hypothetical protein
MMRWLIAFNAVLAVLVVVLDLWASRGWMIAAADGIIAWTFTVWLVVVARRVEGIGGA